MSMVIAFVATLIVLWIAFVVLLVIARPRHMSLRDAGRVVPDVVHLLRGVANDPTLHRGVRRRIAALLVYLALPFDVIPDFIPVLGYADDVIVAVWGVITRSGA